MKKLLALGLAATVAVAGIGALAGCSQGDDELTVGLSRFTTITRRTTRTSLTRSVRLAQTRESTAITSSSRRASTKRRNATTRQRTLLTRVVTSFLRILSAMRSLFFRRQESSLKLSSAMRRERLLIPRMLQTSTMLLHPSMRADILPALPQA